MVEYTDTETNAKADMDMMDSGWAELKSVPMMCLNFHGRLYPNDVRYRHYK